MSLFNGIESPYFTGIGSPYFNGIGSSYSIIRPDISSNENNLLPNQVPSTTPKRFLVTKSTSLTVKQLEPNEHPLFIKTEKQWATKIPQIRNRKQNPVENNFKSLESCEKFEKEIKEKFQGDIFSFKSSEQEIQGFALVKQEKKIANVELHIDPKFYHNDTDITVKFAMIKKLAAIFLKQKNLQSFKLIDDVKNQAFYQEYGLSSHTFYRGIIPYSLDRKGMALLTGKHLTPPSTPSSQEKALRLQEFSNSSSQHRSPASSKQSNRSSCWSCFSNLFTKKNEVVPFHEELD